MRRLIVIDDIPSYSHAIGWVKALLRFFSGRMLSRLAPHIGDASAVLCSEFVADRLELLMPGRVRLWSDIRQNPECWARPLDEFIKFNRQTVEAFDAVEESKASGVSVGKILSYRFIAPHSEGLPLLISGLRDLMVASEADTVELWSGGRPSGILAEDVASTLGRTIRMRRPWELIAVDWLLRVSSIFSLGKSVYASLTLRPARDLFPAATAGQVYFPTYGPSYGIIFPAIFQELRKAGKTPVILSYLPSKIPGADAENFILFDQGGVWSALCSCPRFFRILLNWRRVRRLICLADTDFKGVNIAKHHLAHIRDAYFVYGLKNTKAIPIVREWAENGASAQLFLPNPLELGQIFSAVCASKGWKCFFYWSIEDGMASTRSIWGSCVIGDTVLAVNELQKEFLLAPPSNFRDSISVVGSVAYDGGARNQTRRVEARPSEKKVILILSRHVSNIFTKSDREALFRAVGVVSQELNLSVVVKCHPNEDLDRTIRDISDWGLNFEVSRSASIMDALDGVDVVCGIPASSSALDALKRQVPVVLFGGEKSFSFYNTFPSALSYCLLGAAKKATSSAELKNALMEVFGSDSVRSQLLENGLTFVERLFGPQDGDTARRVVAVISGEIHR